MTSKTHSIAPSKTDFPINTLLIIAVVLQITWGLVPSASKIVIEEIPVELYVALRWTLSGFIFISYLSFTKSWKKISRSDFLSVAGLGILGYGVASLGTLYGLKIGGVSNFALLSALGPVVISSVSILILKERPNRWFYIALPLCVAGLALLVMGKYQVSTLQIAGYSALAIITGYTMEAIVFVFSKRFKAKMPITQYLGIAQCAAAFTFWVLQASYFGQFEQVHQLTQRGLLAALFVAIVACVLCYAVLYWLLSYIDGHKLALFDGIHAVSASVFGYFLFQEPLTPLMLLGGVLIFSGLVVGTLKK
ncbi:MAG: hypothetical protein B7Y39_07735 [Bdellovibrio sp. 28-41-41]|nr:MAG: hypothetical protein B7Y39_07735 [Bdellovibrio sp. 28-41-41]